MANTFLDKQFLCGRPCLLVLIWSFAIAAISWLLLAMMVDELTVANLTQNTGLEYKIRCQSSKFDVDPGNLNQKYKDFTQITEIVLQSQAGDAWLAFGILACLFGIPLTCFGVITDGFAGRYDHKRPVDYYSGCPCLPTWGFTSLGVLFLTVFILFQLIIYGGLQNCRDMADALVANSEIKRNDGASVVMVVFSLLLLLLIPALILFYQYRISAELPTGEAKEAPVKFEKPESTPTEPQEPTPPPAPSGQVPESDYFRPKHNVTRNDRTGTTTTVLSEGDYSGAHREDNTGQGQHDRALSMLAGQPSAVSVAADGPNDGQVTKPKIPPPLPPPKEEAEQVPPPVPYDAIR